VSARVLITREAGSWPALEARFAATPIVLQWDPTTVQVAPLDPRPGEDAVGRLERYDWLVVASVRGVEALTRTLSAAGVDAPPTELRVAAVGPATARALASAGFTVTLVAAEATSNGLAASLRPHVAQGARVLVVGPEGPQSALARKLRAGSAQVHEAPLYRTVASARALTLAEEAIAGRFAAVTFTAPSALTLWLEAAGGRADELAAALGQIQRVAIGPTTEARLAASGLTATAVAEVPTEAAVGDAIARALPASHLLT